MLPEQDRLIESLHKAYFTKLLLYAQAILGNSTAAQDVVQDTFHEAVLKVDKLMTHENPGGWLMLSQKNAPQNFDCFVAHFFGQGNHRLCRWRCPVKKL